MRVGNRTSGSITTGTGSPQGCVLSPLLFSLLTHDCTATLSNNCITKYADEMTVVGLIHNDNKSSYRSEVKQLIEWCRAHNLFLSVEKTKEIIVDFRKNKSHAPLHNEGSAAQRVSSVKFVGVHLADDLKTTVNTTSYQEGSAAPPSTPKAEESRPPHILSYVLQRHRQKCSVPWSYFLVWRLQWTGEETES